MSPEDLPTDFESSNVRHNNEFYNGNLYNDPELLAPQDNLKEKLIEHAESSPRKKESSSGKPPAKLEGPRSPVSPKHSESSGSSQHIDFNLKTTIAHLQSDLVYSIGVFISAVIINLYPDKLYFDSICTILFSYVALELTLPIFRESVRILLEGVAEGGKAG